MNNRILACLLAATSGCASVQNDSSSRTPADRSDSSGVATTNVAASTNALAYDLYERLRAKDGNFAYSPASISTALAMTYAGARSQTATQMQNVLHFGTDSDQLHAAFGAQLATWNDPDRDAYQLAVANRLFGEKTSKFHDDFLKLTQDRYGAALEPVSFRTNAEGSREVINGWVSQRTDKHISNLLPSGSLDSDTRLVLTNAVYFQGGWETPFETSMTRPAKFHNQAGKELLVPTMNLTSEFGYAEVREAQLLEMPYAGGEMSMVIVLPKRAGGLAQVETRLAQGTMDSWMSEISWREVEVALPKWTIDPPQPLSLKAELKELGMPLAFDRTADFSGMADIQPLYIDDVFHKAFVEVSEEGTTAAAATGVAMTAESAVIGGGKPERFVADHPFVFAIRDTRSGALLFMGRVATISQ